MRQVHTFILQVLVDETTTPHVRGYISEPSSTDEWRALFTNLNDLFQRLTERLAWLPSPPQDQNGIEPSQSVTHATTHQISIAAAQEEREIRK